MNRVIKRIANIDMKKIDDLKKSGIYLEFDEDNIFNARAIIFGPEDTIYNGAILYFNITFPVNYPYAPLKINYVPNGNTIRIHPNIYTCGKICLSILGTWPGPKWTSIMDVSCVLLSIKSLLDNNPLYHEPGYSSNNSNHQKLNKEYSDVILHNCVYRLYNTNKNKIPEKFKIFKSIIDIHYESNKNYILNIIKQNKNTNKRVEIPIFRIYELIKYNSF